MDLTEVVAVEISEAAARSGHLEWVRNKLTGDNGQNFFHIKRQSGCSVNLKKSAVSAGSDHASLHFNLKAKKEAAMTEGLKLVKDLIRVVTNKYHEKVGQR